jgi:ribosomal protein L11 methyltransferase
MNYIELEVSLAADFADILTAELAELGFDSFVETDEGLNAYIPEAEFQAAALQEVIDKYAAQTAIVYHVKTLEKRNWNEEWEQSYHPIDVSHPSGKTARVRASFHEPIAADEPNGTDAFDIIINPKMSFGTGHHETTAMMIEHQLGLDSAGKKVMDVGSGTGILAILAALQGATEVVAFDIEEWAVENARENADLNGCPQIEIFQGMIDQVNESRQFDIVLANINRNILLQDIPAYVQRMAPGATLLVSGFYEADAQDITQKAVEAGLQKEAQLTKNNWESLRFKKVEL